MAHGPHQTYKHVCLSHKIISHWGRHLKVRRFHVQSKICQRWACVSHGSNRLALLLWVDEPSRTPPQPVLKCPRAPTSSPCSWKRPNPSLLAGWHSPVGRGGMRKERSTEVQTNCSLQFPVRVDLDGSLAFWSGAWPRAHRRRRSTVSKAL